MHPEIVIARCDLADPRVLARVHALQRDAYRIEAELVGCWQMPGLVESMDDLAATSEVFFAARVESGADASAAVGGEIAGVIATLVEPDPVRPDGACVCISRLAVDPAVHRRGIALALVNHVIVQSELPVIVSTGAANMPTRRLYERLGFRHARDYRTPDGVTPLVAYRWERG